VIAFIHIFVSKIGWESISISGLPIGSFFNSAFLSDV